MSPITFKFFTPRGDCRRVTYEAVPTLATINELVDGMVEGRRTLTYRDSEGDIVLLKTSRDVVEAVKDAKDSGVKSIRVKITMVREFCPRKQNESKTTPAASTNNNGNNDSNSSNNNNNRNSCGNNRNSCGGGGRHAKCRRMGGAPQWGRCWSRGLFGHPHHINVDLENVSNEVEEIIKHFAPFFGIDVSPGDHGAAEKANEEAAPASGSESHDHPSNENDAAQETAKQETAKQVVKTEKAVETPEAETTAAVTTPAPTSEQADRPAAVASESEASGSDFTFVENEPEADETAEASTPPEAEQKAKDDAKEEAKPADASLGDKLKLLKEMGFQLPEGVARNMIKELNGRMDLIVRALVANQK